ncbi:MAG: AAA family ATPase, partial [Polyangiaceae bacterium]|nr:AAA family ATPase [Polyangiaceae bacterium]
RARRPVLLEGPTGIGKSELVRGLAGRLGIESVVLDLSLLEPPDLIGLPIVEDGVTRYATPRILPQGGAGILMLEELNRAERFIQQPALQLLSARTLHEYVLPEGWVVFAAINPESGEYQVTPLDKALRARFLELHVRADRSEWLAWAAAKDLHPAVLGLARQHERIFDEVPPRTWTYVAELLASMREGELRDGVLLRDVLSGYLPAVWVEALVEAGATSPVKLELDLRTLLRSYRSGSEAQKTLEGWKLAGSTDRIAELATRLESILAGPEVGAMAARGDLVLGALEALLGDLPGDHRVYLQRVLAKNSTAVPLIELSPRDVLVAYERSGAMKRVDAWLKDPSKLHRVGLLVTSVAAYLRSPNSAIEAKKSNPMRASLGYFLAQVGPEWGMPLVEVLKRIGVTPIRPGRD